jgi:hypothetical protein
MTPPLVQDHSLRCSTRQFTLIRCSKMVAYKKDRLEIDARSTVYVQCTFPATAPRPNTCRWATGR